MISNNLPVTDFRMFNEQVLLHQDQIILRLFAMRTNPSILFRFYVFFCKFDTFLVTRSTSVINCIQSCFKIHRTIGTKVRINVTDLKFCFVLNEQMSLKSNLWTRHVLAKTAFYKTLIIVSCAVFNVMICFFDMFA